MEDRIRGRSAEFCAWCAASWLAPPVDSLKLWLEAELHRVAPCIRLSDAYPICLGGLEALCRFLEDGRIALDTGRTIRPIALGRKNHLFADSMALPTAGPSCAR